MNIETIERCCAAVQAEANRSGANFLELVGVATTILDSALATWGETPADRAKLHAWVMGLVAKLSVPAEEAAREVAPPPIRLDS